MVQRLKFRKTACRVAFDPTDACRLATSSDERRQAIRLWSTTTGEVLRTFQGGHGAVSVHGLAFSPSGTQLLSMGTLTSVCLWDVASGALVRRYEVPGIAEYNIASALQAVTFTRDGARIVVSCAGSVLRIYDATTGAAVHTAEAAHKVVDQPAAALATTGRFLLSGGQKGMLHLRDPATGQLRHALKARRPKKKRKDGVVPYIVRVAATADGRRAMTMDSRAILFWAV